MMPVVQPFRGIRYNPRVVGTLDRVVAPPYDVISTAEQDRLYESSDWNVIRLDLSKDTDRYGSSAALYRKWQEDGALRRDEVKSFYVYAQSFDLDDGGSCERWGFFTRLKIEEFSSGKVLPHEKTHDGPKEDRLALQRACSANLSSIFAVYAAPGFRLMDAVGDTLADTPLGDITDTAGVRHRFWQVSDPRVCRVLSATLADRTVYIADGHHRYETALRYRNERREETDRTEGEEPFDYVLAFLVNMEEPGLVILPTHRVLRELPIEVSSFVAGLADRFQVQEISCSEGVDALLDAVRGAPEGERRIGVSLRDYHSFLVLTAKDGEHDEQLHGPTALRRLDVTLLHSLVIEGPGSLLGINSHEAVEAGQLVYVKGDRAAVRMVENGEAAVAFLLNATRLDEVRSVCESGETMPEKSTYFYPKILTGLVFNSVED
jgi:uncharacterized protein (DUF1015 family)